MKRALWFSLLALAVSVALFPALPLHAQDKGQATTFKPEELEQLVAPIALYPDSLVAQVLMASTYPLEVVEAARWSKGHPDVKGDAVSKEMEKQSWDPSVKSLVAFPEVLAMMNEKLDWTQRLGDAFLAQQKELMDAVQRLRARAKAEGNLKSSKEQTVKTEPAPAGSSTTTIIQIEPTDPQVVYVPTYNPTVVYGAWPYPAYPPYYYYPPGYAAGAAFFSFSVGVVVGGALWGDCNWGYGDVDIDINNYNKFNNIDIDNRPSPKNQKWEHNSEHRKGVGYRDSATQQKFGKASDRSAMQSREQFRGRAEQGREQIAREGAGTQRDLAGNRIGSQTRDAGGGLGASSREASDGDRQFNQGSGDRSSSRGSSSRSSGRESSAFSGMSNGSSARTHSSRGASSRSAGGFSRGGGRRR